MTTITIKQGLRRLDFSPSSARENEQGSGRQKVVVEFVRVEPLGLDQFVRIHLGVRMGAERVLEGKPALLKATTGRTSEYLYRLEGEVA